jgi:3-hydroxybutyryl-CoA dehydrogenase
LIITPDWVRVESEEDFFKSENADIYINLLENAAEADYSSISKPLIINSVNTPLHEISAPSNLVRINGWPGFLQRKSWELAGPLNDELHLFFLTFGLKVIEVKDSPGFVSARVIAMIINEAYYALAQKVSNKQSIDIAMKLGTNYPYGPFEWANKIGIEQIATLLKKLSLEDKRYTPSLMLLNEATN